MQGEFKHVCYVAVFDVLCNINQIFSYFLDLFEASKECVVPCVGASFEWALRVYLRVNSYIHYELYQTHATALQQYSKDQFEKWKIFCRKGITIQQWSTERTYLFIYNNCDMEMSLPVLWVFRLYLWGCR